ncbi:hypothetical protein BDV33DRAFT_210895 [Aspergillus novoparasiticus]|uniref:Uncharacterized protein n=1 Tax=Aspergillus novoparasiticus TaxID=986946 RepID=A0A5N6E5C7_9EURO|nr:hypothetical protein BDV33DRAFT_210895 [Aspergillus novoparasiticus]
MGRFLDTKALQLVNLCDGPEHLKNALFDNLLCMWSESPNRTLGESLDVLEVFDFTSNYLLLLILDSPSTLVDWRYELGEHDENSLMLDYDETPLENWMNLLFRLQPHLSPFDILSLFKKGRVDIKELLFLTSLIGLPKIYNNDYPGMKEIEYAVPSKLQGDRNVDDAWKAYRCHHWRLEVRGRVFNWDFKAEKIADAIPHVDRSTGVAFFPHMEDFPSEGLLVPEWYEKKWMSDI